MKHIKKFDDKENFNLTNNVKLQENIDYDYIKNDLSKKFRSLDLEFLNGLNKKKLLKTAIYSYIHEIELISRENDGKLSGKIKMNEDDLEIFLNKTINYIKELENFFKNVE